MITHIYAGIYFHCLLHANFDYCILHTIKCNMGTLEDIYDLITSLEEYNKKLTNCYLMYSDDRINFKYIHLDDYLEIYVDSTNLECCGKCDPIMGYVTHIQIKLSALEYMYLIYNKLGLFNKVKHSLGWHNTSRLTSDNLYVLISAMKIDSTFIISSSSINLLMFILSITKN